MHHNAERALGCSESGGKGAPEKTGRLLRRRLLGLRAWVYESVARVSVVNQSLCEINRAIQRVPICVLRRMRTFYSHIT